MKEKYVLFKDDDAGKDFYRLKKWVDVVLDKDAKGAIGLIGKYMKNEQLRGYLNSLDSSKIEVFCHGYSHSYLPFLVRKISKKNSFIKTEFNKSLKNHENSLKKYRTSEKKYLNQKTITFGPPGNIWNKDVSKALVDNGFKMMFSWYDVGNGIFTIYLNDNFKQNSLEEFIEDYKKNKNKDLFVLQFHHANLSEKQFDLMEKVIDYLKNEEHRIFITPSELFNMIKKGEIHI